MTMMPDSNAVHTNAPIGAVKMTDINGSPLCASCGKPIKVKPHYSDGKAYHPSHCPVCRTPIGKAFDG